MNILSCLVKAVILLVGITLGNLFFWRLGDVVAFTLLTFVIGLAIVGSANWFKWIAAFLIVAVLFGLLFFFVAPYIPKKGVFIGLGLFGFVPLLPAGFIALACFIRDRNSVPNYG